MSDPVPRQMRHQVHAVAAQPPTPPTVRAPLWRRALRMPLLWALLCGVLALPGYAAGGDAFLPFLLTLVGGWLCGMSFVNATARMSPPRRGAIAHVLGAIAAGLLLAFLAAVVPDLLAPKPNPARAVVAVVQMAAAPAAGWIWLALIGRITSALRLRATPAVLEGPEWEGAERGSGSVLRFAAVPLTMRALTLWILLVVVVVAGIGVALMIAFDAFVMAAGPRLVIVALGIVLGLPAYLLLSALLRRRTVTYTVRFDVDRLELERAGSTLSVRYADVERLVWRSDSEYARLEVLGEGVDLSLIAGIARVPKGRTAALPPLSRRVRGLLEGAGLSPSPSRNGRVQTFIRDAG
ncbi:hypothetical protein [Microbacterium azadirachtae]|uniref:hypothetical protein n=1 Tax=Microbacterium azadirachtae TaxID=582680 RepID=UPI003F751C10